MARGALLVVLGLCAWQVLGLRLETDITRFLPEGEDRDRLALGSLVRATGFSRGLVAAVEAPPGLQADEAARVLAPVSDAITEALRASPRFRVVRNGAPAGVDRAFWDAYFPRRLAFLSDRPEAEIPARLSPDGLAAAARDLKDQLSLPSGAAIKRLADRDPLLAFPGILGRLAAVGADTAPRTHEGRWYSQDLRHALVTAETVAPAYDTEAQAAAIADLRGAFDRASQAAGGGFRLGFTGLGRFVLEGQELVKGDIEWASLASTIGVALLFLAFFRRLRYLPFAFAPVAAGVLAGLGVVLAAHGSIHGLTLAFGTTLIGVGIDYPIQWLNHHRYGRFPDGDAEARSRRRLQGNLAAGAVTTMAGFLVLTLSSYPGIREIGLFCGAGVAGAWASTVLFLPLVRPWVPAAEGVPPRWQSWLDDFAARGRRHRLPIGVFLATLAAASALAATRMTLQSDARALDTSAPATRAEDAAVRAHLPASRFPLVVLVSGTTPQEALERNDALHADLVALRETGEVARFAGLHPFLPSAALQRRNLAALAAIPDPAPAARTALAAAGFRPDAFAGFFQSLADARAGAVRPLEPRDLDGTPLADLVKGFLFVDGDRTYALTLVQPSRADDAFLAALPDAEGRVKLNQAALVSGMFNASQRETLVLFLLGLAANAVLVGLYRRRLRDAVLSLLPTFLAVLAVVGGIALLVPFNFLHVVALLLILAMGIDYAVFLVASRRGLRGNDEAVAALSVLLSALTTALSYAFLAVCRTPALAGIGGAVAAGVTLVCLLTFLSNLLAPGEGQG